MTYIGIDSTGVGHGVYENVKAFFQPSGSLSTTPTLKTLWFSRPTTLSATAVWSLTPGTPTLRSHSWQSVAPPPPAATAQRYEASRSEEASHADLAPATMHALFNEPLQGESANTSNIVEIFDEEPEALTSCRANRSYSRKRRRNCRGFQLWRPDPVVLDRRELLDYVECVQMDRWYEPPVSFDGLARTLPRRCASQLTDCR